MAFHTLAYTSDQAFGVQNTDTPGVFDGYASLQNNHYLLPEDARLGAAWAGGANISAARLNCPSVRVISLPNFSPLNVGAAVVTTTPLVNYMPYGLRLPAVDEIAVETSNTAGAGTTRQNVALWAHDGNMNVPQGEIITVRATAAVTGTAFVWNPGVFTLVQTLPRGRYSVVGFDVVGANALLARLVFPMGGRKPGVVARATHGIVPNNLFRGGNFGEFGQFEQTALPSFELFPSAAGTTQELFLDLVKIR